MDIKNNLVKVRKQINPDTVIVAATKYVSTETMQELYNNGITNFGENRVESFLEKYDVMNTDDISWHFIGTLQSKKVKKIINCIDYLHSLDRLSLAKEINKYRTSVLPCFIQVNISNEENKHGVAVNDVANFINELRKYDKIKIVGFMGMAEHSTDRETIISQFMTLKNLLEDDTIKKLDFCNIQYLSMGMSNDYQYAIECGATHIRLGSILFQ